ncbi:molybdopterin-dependent oxidoreductase [Actinomadura flavalba]|uniref:molybdopterin-dependent oxidoreductase n=1 Tax=Actinomadura flavalba TaxID=1120938 RepID=UPI0003758F7E|nr:molybdopterin-dependent oxidoreductase [Actinomadura flavalba]
MTQTGQRAGRITAAGAGIVAAAVALGVAELCAAFVRPQAAPLIAVGGAGIDRTPEWLKSWAIRTFGESDKAVLLGGLVAGVAVLAALLGLLGRTRPRWAAAGFAAFGAVGAAAALTRPDAGPADAVPVVLGACAATGALLLMLRPPRPVLAGSQRRAFLIFTGVAAGTGVLGRVLNARRDVAAARDAIRLPPPADPAKPLPAGADLRVKGLTTFTTPNKDFYRVDTALTLPQVDPSDWTLRVHGLVDRPFEITFDELLRRPLTERDITLTCVSNEVGGPYAGHARWLGVDLADLLREAGVRAGADQIFSRSADGMTISTPLSAVLDGRDALLAVGMNGEPLPVRHGFPARMVVPGLYGYVSATKWVVDLKVSRFATDRAYWTRRRWAEQAPIKTMARIDVPRAFGEVKAGRVPIAGVAWAQHRGIDAVEVRVDGGPWRRARLAPVPSSDTWRQWFLEWDATAGSHRVEARAIDGTGAVQTERRADPIPDGASGWHSVVITVT